jgi:hypothetical protein
MLNVTTFLNLCAWRQVHAFCCTQSENAREFSIFDEADEVLVCRDGRRACRQTEHEGLVRRRPEVVDPTRSD